MSKIEIIQKKINEDKNIDDYKKKKTVEEKKQIIESLLEMLRSNPDITEEKIHPRLRKYLGVAKKQYKKELSDVNNSIKSKYKDLHEACKKYPRIQLNATSASGSYMFDAENFVDNFAEDGFIETFCLMKDERNEVKKLRLERKLNKKI